jgi:hypothetical protein
MPNPAELATPPAALVSGEPLWQGRNAFAPILTVAFPMAMLVALFIAILWSVGPNIQSGFWRIGGSRIPMSAADLKVTGWMFVTAVPLLLALAVGYPVWRICRVHTTITKDAVIAKDGRLTVVWPIGELRELTFEDSFGWYQVRFLVSSGKPPSVLVSGDDAILLANIAMKLGLACTLPDRLKLASKLAPDETIRWSGRRGFGSFHVGRWVGLGVMSLPIFAYLWWMWAIWKDFEFLGPISLMPPLMWSFFALMLVGFTSFGIVIQFRSMVLDWFRDALGTIAVTDRRIVFRSPITGRIYHLIAADDLLWADLVSTKGNYGWITVRLRSDGQDHEIYSVPDPNGALAAIRSLIRS